MCYYNKYYCPVCTHYSHTTIARDCEGGDDCTSTIYYIRHLEEDEGYYLCCREDIEE
jgi:hypothetical protein